MSVSDVTNLSTLSLFHFVESLNDVELISVLGCGETESLGTSATIWPIVLAPDERL
jgi:hypothetical protein